MVNESPPSSEVCFFLGAGASVEAGVPDTYGLVQEFRREYSSNKPLSDTIDHIIAILQRWRDTQNSDAKVDVELLLETLEKLDKPNQEALLQFYKTSDFALSGYQDKRPIIEILRDFIKSHAIVNRLGVQYLEPLLEFIEQFGSVDVFSVNYDTAIEQFCSVYRKTCVDGFDSEWNPDSFNKKTDIRLYKLHGSVTWYRTDNGEYLKVPVRVSTDSLKLITEQKASSLILYPMRKWQYTEPLLELLFMLKDALERTKCCIVVGYSFRDEHITRIFWDAARKNPDLHLILVGPSAERVYQEKIRLYREGPDDRLTVPSSVDTRVVCLPYKFGLALPHLREIHRNLSNGLRLEQAVTRGRLLDASGQEWIPMLNQSVHSLVEAEHLERVEKLCSIMEWSALPFRWQERFELSYKMWFNKVWRVHDKDQVEKWAKRFAEALETFTEGNLDVWMGQIPNIMLRFRADMSIRNPSEVIRDLQSVSQWATEKLTTLSPMNDKAKFEAFDHLSRATRGLDGLLLYVRQWSSDRMEIGEYIQARGFAKDKVEQIRSEFDGFKTSGFQGQLKLAPRVVSEIEWSLLQPIITGIRSNISA